ncbi:hypothetical protein [Sulfitobacter sp. M22]|uniref:hypothetical protein n=1 Tax=Sulfitobacter sp. M22 TaxID=2675332 RepID=UPI001F1EDE7A|nr:hypothetical protein [Sulfitobacter sp. M22]MCF7725531.1 hypothetical protein [Sulfitobacter sp. M22]
MTDHPPDRLLNASDQHPSTTVQTCAKGAIGLEKWAVRTGRGRGKTASGWDDANMAGSVDPDRTAE